VLTRPRPPAQAKQYCQSRYRDLASIHSDDESDIAFSVCEASQTMNTCVDRFVDAGTCTGAAGCWIGLHQQVGQRYSTDEVTAFDNTGQCHVDHRISDALYDIPLDKIRVVTQDGTAKEWNMKGNPTLRSLLLGPWHGVAGENDRYKFLAGSREGNVRRARTPHTTHDTWLMTRSMPCAPRRPLRLARAQDATLIRQGPALNLKFTGLTHNFQLTQQFD
jgi:hypothetical protein